MLSFNDKRWMLAPAAILTLLIIPASTVACSLVGCIDGGVELRRNFIVTVTHQDKPFPGVSVQITGNSDVAGHQSFSELTGVDGTAKRGTLLLARREAGGGTCGGTSLEIKDSKLVKIP